MYHRKHEKDLCLMLAKIGHMAILYSLCGVYTHDNDVVLGKAKGRKYGRLDALHHLDDSPAFSQPVF